MKILDINFLNFRNLEDENLRLSEKINIFYGRNGQGKTSILEAIYFNCTGVSFRTKKTNELINYKKNGIFLSLTYQDYIGKSKLSVKYESKRDAKKEFFFNNKKISQSDFYGKLNIIAYVPEDIILINGSPKNRRDFFDMEISQSDKLYLKYIKDYNKLLKIRNKLLKENKSESKEFQIYEEEFIKYGAKIIYIRVAYLKSLSIILNLLYRKLFAQNQELNISYESFLTKNQKVTLEDIEKAFKKELLANRLKEIRYKFSLVGPHKDDYKFMLNSHEAKMNASQGEKKSIIFSLKLSEIEMIRKIKKENPIVIIDDITSYFDEARRNSILNFLHKNEIQVLISSTEKLNIEANNFFVEKGTVVSDEYSKT